MSVDTWRETLSFRWSNISDWKELVPFEKDRILLPISVHSSIESNEEYFTRGGIVGTAKKAPCFFWRYKSDMIEILPVDHKGVRNGQGLRIGYQSPIYCSPSFLCFYSSQDTTSLVVFIAHSTGHLTKLSLTFQEGRCLDNYDLQTCHFPSDVFVKYVIAISSDQCIAVMKDCTTIFRFIFSSVGHSFQLIEIPVAKRNVSSGVFGRVFRKRLSSQEPPSEIIALKLVLEQQFLLVVNTSGIFSLIDLQSLQCVAQTKYQKLVCNEWSDIISQDAKHFLAFVFIDQTPSFPAFHVLKVTLEMDEQSLEEGKSSFSIVLELLLSYSSPVHLIDGCWIEKYKTLLVADEEAKLFSLTIPLQSNCPIDLDSLTPVLDFYYFDNVNESMGSIGWALDQVYANHPIQKLFVPFRYSDTVLANTLQQPAFSSRQSLYSYVQSHYVRLEDYERVLVTASRISMEKESKILGLSMDDSYSIPVVIRQECVSILRPIEAFERLSLEHERMEQDATEQSTCIKLLDLVNNTILLSEFSSLLLYKSLGYLFLQWVSCLKAWKQKRNKDTLEEDFILTFAPCPSQSSLSLIDRLWEQWTTKDRYSIPLLETGSENTQQPILDDDCREAMKYFVHIFSRGPMILLFLYQNKEWDILLQVCEILKDICPLACNGVGCWVLLKLERIELALSFLTRFLEQLETNMGDEKSFPTHSDWSYQVKVVEWVTGIQQQPLSFWFLAETLKWLERRGYTEEAIPLGKKALVLAPNEQSQENIRTLLFNVYLSNHDRLQALDLILSTSNVSQLASWMDDFYLLIQSFADNQQLMLLKQIDLPSTLCYRIGDILYLRWKGKDASCHSLSNENTFMSLLLESFAWYSHLREWYLASRVLFEGYCRWMKSFETSEVVPWITSCVHLCSLCMSSLEMMPYNEQQYLLIDSSLLQALDTSGLLDWISKVENCQVSAQWSCYKLRSKWIKFILIIRRAQQTLLEFTKDKTMIGLHLFKRMDIQSVSWLWSQLMNHQLWNDSFQVAWEASFYLESHQLMISWFRLFGYYWIEHTFSMEQTEKNTLWSQICHWLKRAKCLDASKDVYASCDSFGLALLQGMLSHTHQQWIIPMWLLQVSGWGIEHSFLLEKERMPGQPYNKNKVSIGNMSALWKLLIENGRIQEAIAFLCSTLERNIFQDGKVIVSWTLLDHLNCFNEKQHALRTRWERIKSNLLD